MKGPPILVGVDGSAPSLAAVDLAIREGTLRERAVRIVYGDPWADHPAWANIDQAAELVGDMVSEPQQVICAALEHAAGAPVTVTADILAGDAATVLIRESAHTDLLMIGQRGRGGFAELLLGSVAIKVAAHAACPVIITRGDVPAGHDVLVGVDGSAADEAPLGFAFHEAALRGTDLRALHAWNQPELVNPDVLFLYDTGPEDAAHAQLLTDALLPWSRKYPEVKVHHYLVKGNPADAIIQVGPQAQLIVLGARGHARLPGRRLGSVTHAVLHHAACPVTIVR